jgi:hypothetical protein
VFYPDGKAYGYGYDGVSRPVSLTDNQPTPVAWVNNVQYGLSGELLQMTYAGLTAARTYRRSAALGCPEQWATTVLLCRPSPKSVRHSETGEDRNPE